MFTFTSLSHECSRDARNDNQSPLSGLSFPVGGASLVTPCPVAYYYLPKRATGQPEAKMLLTDGTCRLNRHKVLNEFLGVIMQMMEVANTTYAV